MQCFKVGQKSSYRRVGALWEEVRDEDEEEKTHPKVQHVNDLCGPLHEGLS